MKTQHLTWDSEDLTYLLSNEKFQPPPPHHHLPPSSLITYKVQLLLPKQPQIWIHPTSDHVLPKNDPFFNSCSLPKSSQSKTLMEGNTPSIYERWEVKNLFFLVISYMNTAFTNKFSSLSLCPPTPQLSLPFPHKFMALSLFS